MADFHKRKGYHPPRDERNWVADFETKWITKEIEDETIKFCDTFAKEIAKEGFTAAQLRKIFSEIKRIESNKEFSKKDFILLKPKIAYTSAKSKNKRVSTKFSNVILKAHSCVSLNNNEITKLHFTNFCDFVEAIVAYHKVYYKGKD